MTVRELREFIKDLPDNIPVAFVLYENPPKQREGSCMECKGPIVNRDGTPRESGILEMCWYCERNVPRESPMRRDVG